MRLERLEDRTLYSTAIKINSFNVTSGVAGTTLNVPINTVNPDGGKITYSFKSSNPAVTGSFTSNTQYLDVAVANFGHMVFQLFNDAAPKTVATMEGLARSGFFTNTKFHRVISNFVIQGGDPLSKNPFVDNGTAGTVDPGDNIWGTGGPGFTTDDEFQRSTIFSGSGQLAMANGGKDTQGSQFFVTSGLQRALDFNHTIWGQLVSGFDVAKNIGSVAVDSNDRPTTDVTVTSVSVISDPSDGVLRLNIPKGTAASNLGKISVYAKSSTGVTTARSFTLARTAEATNDPPVLGNLPAGFTTAKNTPIKIALSSFDRENSAVSYDSAVLDSTPQATVTVSGNVVTVTPKTNYTGPVHVLVGVRSADGTGRGSTQDPFDKEAITIGVGDKPASGSGTAVAAVKRVALSNVRVATFTDSDKAGRSSDWRLTINWGDGTITGGAITKSGSSFIVTGTHTYTGSAGAYPVTTTITGKLGAVAVFTSTATVKNPPPVASSSQFVSAAAFSTVAIKDKDAIIDSALVTV